VKGGFEQVQALTRNDAVAAALGGLGGKKAREDFAKRIDSIIAKMKDDSAATIKRAISDLAAANQRTVKLPEEVLAVEMGEGVCNAVDPFTSMVWPND